MKRGIICMASVLALLAGCGQRGDLYLPEAEREAVITVPAQLPGAAPTSPDEDADETAAPPAPAQPGATGNAPAATGQ